MVTRVTKTLTPVRGRRYRVTRLDACGNPEFGLDGQTVTDGVITATFTATSTATDEIRIVNSSGDTCVFEPAVTSLEGYSAEIQFCGLDPDMFNMMTGMPVITDIDDRVVGIAIDVDVDLDDFSFGLEIWTGLASDDACGEVGETEYGYILLPFMKGGSLGDFTVENNAINFTVTGATSRKGGSWAKGPYCVVENSGSVSGPLLTAVSSTQVMLLMRTNVAPPAASDGGLPLLDLDWTELASITPTPDDLEVDFVIAPAILSGEGVFYDFGDGEWQYITGPGTAAVTHTYAEAGSYTATAQAGGCTVVSTDLTLTEGS